MKTIGEPQNTTSGRGFFSAAASDMDEPAAFLPGVPDRPQRLFFSVIASDGSTDSAPAVVRVDVVLPEVRWMKR